MTDLSTAYTNACPLFTRARSLGGRTGEALEVHENGTAHGHMIAFAIGAAVAMALIAWGL